MLWAFVEGKKEEKEKEIVLEHITDDIQLHNKMQTMPVKKKQKKTMPAKKKKNKTYTSEGGQSSGI